MKNVMFNTIPQAAFTRLVIEATNKFREIHNTGSLVIEEKKGKNLDSLRAAIEELNLGYKATVSMLKALNDVEGACGSKKTSRRPTAEELDKQKLVFVPYAAVVPTRNRNNHAYVVGEPVIMIHGDEGADHGMFGMDGNGCIISKSTKANDGLSHLPRFRKSLRPATTSEIYRIIEKLYR